MHRTTIALIQASFTRISPQAADVAERFYTRLFELDPTLRPLFGGDMTRQGLKLMTTLQLAVAALDDLGKITPALQRLGRNHQNSGVRDEDYATVGAALLDTLNDMLGADFSPELRSAWGEAYGLLTTVMRAATDHTLYGPG
jgi:hemoglobin-like flavoprotein